MNTKGIKFLAVLAVLAMAFAAFAVIADAEGNDAATATVDGTLENGGDVTAGKAYYFAGTGAAAETEFPAGTTTVYMLATKMLDAKGAAATGCFVKIYVASAISETTVTYNDSYYFTIELDNTEGTQITAAATPAVTLESMLRVVSIDRAVELSGVGPTYTVSMATEFTLDAANEGVYISKKAAGTFKVTNDHETAANDGVMTIANPAADAAGYTQVVFGEGAAITTGAGNQILTMVSGIAKHAGDISTLTVNAISDGTLATAAKTLYGPEKLIDTTAWYVHGAINATVNLDATTELVNLAKSTGTISIENQRNHNNNGNTDLITNVVKTTGVTATTLTVTVGDGADKIGTIALGASAAGTIELVKGDFTIGAVATSGVVIDHGATLKATGVTTGTGPWLVNGTLDLNTQEINLTNLNLNIGYSGAVTGAANATNKTTANVKNVVAGSTSTRGGDVKDIETWEDVTLTSDVTVPKDATLTLKGFVGLSGYSIKVTGTLVIDSSAVIFSTEPVISSTVGMGGASFANTIILDKGGKIENNGVIGAGQIVTVTTQNGAATTETDSYVELQGVNGVVLSRNATTGKLVASGVIGPMFDDNIDVNGIATYNVNITSDMTIVTGVTLNAAATTNLSKTLTVNGILAGNALYMNNGSKVIMNGFSTANIKANVKEAVPVDTPETDIEYVVNEVVGAEDGTNHVTPSGYTLSIERIQYLDLLGNALFNQRLFIEGSVVSSSSSVDPAAVTALSFKGMAFVAEDKTLTVGAKFKLAGVGAAPDNGTIIAQGLIASTNAEFNGNNLTIVGASYNYAATAVTPATYYASNIEDALLVIDDVAQKTIVITGYDAEDTKFDYVIDEDLTLTTGQKINSIGAPMLYIDSGVLVTLETGVTVAPGVFRYIEGALEVQNGASCVPATSTYAVMVKDASNNRTYAGFQTAMDAAEAGDTVTLASGMVGNVLTLTVIDGVKVVIEGTLNVQTTLSVLEGGEFELETGSVLNVGVEDTYVGRVNVAGTMDIHSGTFNIYNKGTDTTWSSVSSTGKIALSAAQREAITAPAYKCTVNGAWYNDATNGYNVLTNVATAAAASSGKITVIGEVTETADVVLKKSAELAIAGVASFQKVDISKGAKVTSTGTFSGTITGTNGEMDTPVTVKVTKMTAGDITQEVDKINTYGNTESRFNLAGTTAITATAIEFVSGDALVKGNLTGANANLSTIVIGKDAFAYIEAADVTIATFKTVTVNGAIVVDEDTTLTSGVMTIVNGSIDVLSGATLAFNAATVQVNGDIDVFEAGVANVRNVYLLGSLNVDSEADTPATFIINNSLYADQEYTAGTAAIIGKITFTGTVLSIPAGSSITEESFTAELAKTTFYINGVEITTLYSAAADTVAIQHGNVNTYFYGYKIEGLDLSNINEADQWYLDAAMTKANPNNPYLIGQAENLYFGAEAGEANVKYSIGTGISMFVDGIRVETGGNDLYKVGTHTVTVSINPGYKGTTTLTFNGVQITDGKFAITASMVGKDTVLSVTGDITIDPGVSPEPTPAEKEAFGITEILLVVLVILIAVMVIVVLMRMNRS